MDFRRNAGKSLCNKSLAFFSIFSPDEVRLDPQKFSKKMNEIQLAGVHEANLDWLGKFCVKVVNLVFNCKVYCMPVKHANAGGSGGMAPWKI